MPATSSISTWMWRLRARIERIGLGDLWRREPCCRNLVQQRLEEVMVLAIHHRDPRLAPELLAEGQATEACSEHEDVRRSRSLFVHV